MEMKMDKFKEGAAQMPCFPVGSWPDLTLTWQCGDKRAAMFQWVSINLARF